MNSHTGMVVESTAGHDKGWLFLVVKAEEDRLYLANGRQRRLANPKCKNKGHVSPVTQRLPKDSDGATGEGQMRIPQSDKELRRTLAALKEVITLGER